MDDLASLLDDNWLEGLGNMDRWELEAAKLLAPPESPQGNMIGRNGVLAPAYTPHQIHAERPSLQIQVFSATSQVGKSRRRSWPRTRLKRRKRYVTHDWNSKA